MPTKAETKVDTRERESEIARLKDEIADLRRVAARVSPSTLTKGATATITSYTDDLPERVLALAMVGMWRPEIRHELGITIDDWRQWRVDHEDFNRAVRRGEDAAKAYWHSRMRAGANDNNWKMPYKQMTQMIDDLSRDPADEAPETGDASKLVRLDGSTCTNCRPCDACAGLKRAA